MSTAVTFNDSVDDKKLVKDIEEYQKKKKLRSRVDAVRNLCRIALKTEQIIDKGEDKQ